MRMRVLAVAVPTLVVLAGAAKPRATEPSAQQAAVDTTVVIRSTGPSLEYFPPRLALKNGLRVRIRFINDGTLPHNIVFPKTEDDIDALGLAAMDADETGYVPVAMKARMIAYSTLAAPNQTVEVTFVVPAPGEYWYVCLYPGHKANMLGTLRSLR